jgi:DNA-binding ferritin-like protein
MSLENLLGRSLERSAAERAGIARMLAAAERNIADAQLAALSPENRFDAAYKSILQCAMIALAKDRMIVLDALRKQRSLADYEGDPVTAGTVADCLAQARQLLADVKAWLAKNKPELC